MSRQHRSGVGRIYDDDISRAGVSSVYTTRERQPPSSNQWSVHAYGVILILCYVNRQTKHILQNINFKMTKAALNLKLPSMM